MTICTWSCSHLHCGGPIGEAEPRIWYCTHPDAPKQPLPDTCHDAREGMLLGDAFAYGGPCAMQGALTPTLFPMEVAS